MKQYLIFMYQIHKVQDSSNLRNVLTKITTLLGSVLKNSGVINRVELMTIYI